VSINGRAFPGFGRLFADGMPLEFWLAECVRLASISSYYSCFPTRKEQEDHGSHGFHGCFLSVSSVSSVVKKLGCGLEPASSTLLAFRLPSVRVIPASCESLDSAVPRTYNSRIVASFPSLGRPSQTTALAVVRPSRHHPGDAWILRSDYHVA
jgi:hypothetical protein